MQTNMSNIEWMQMSYSPVAYEYDDDDDVNENFLISSSYVCIFYSSAK